MMKKILMVAALAAVVLCGCKKETNSSSNNVNTDPTNKAKFSVADGKQVNFASGNLRYNSNTNTWSFAEHQYDFDTANNGTNGIWDYFGWSTSSTNYGASNTTGDENYAGNFVDWGGTIGNGWRTLTSDEWKYLLNYRTCNGGTGEGHSYKRTTLTLPNGSTVYGMIIVPDTYYTLTNPSLEANTSWTNWQLMEDVGCVFLPAAGYRRVATNSGAGVRAHYWSSTPDGADNAYYLYFYNSGVNAQSSSSRYMGRSVRLVKDVNNSLF